MFRQLSLSVALILLISMMLPCSIADEAFPLPAEGYTSEAVFQPEESSNDEASEIPPTEETGCEEACLSDVVDALVPEAECMLDDQGSDAPSEETDAASAESDAVFCLEAMLADGMDSTPPEATEIAPTAAEIAVEQDNSIDLFKADSAPSIQTLRLGIGEKYSLPNNPADKWSFTSSNKKVATVTANGVIKGKKRGQARVVMSDGKAAYEYVVRVLKAPKRISFPKKKLMLVYDPASGKGNAAQLKPRLSSKSSSRIRYYGYNRKIVSVSADGVVTAVGVGSTRVRAKTFNKKQASIKITVANASRQPTVIAHRGSAHWEENTLTAFQNFPSTGADAVELDARSCLDGTQVIFHDPSFEVNGVTYRVAKLTLKQLRSLNPSICTLDEALDVIASSGKDIFLELKETANGAKCVSSVQAHGLQSRTVYFSFFETPLKQVHSVLPSAILGLSLKGSAKPYSKALIKKAKRLHLSFFMANRKLMSKKLVKHWHRKGYKVHVWTVNSKAAIRRLYDMGVDGILTDLPENCIRAWNS